MCSVLFSGALFGDLHAAEFLPSLFCSFLSSQVCSSVAPCPLSFTSLSLLVLSASLLCHSLSSQLHFSVTPCPLSFASLSLLVLSSTGCVLQAADYIIKLYNDVFIKYDATMLEINPMSEDNQGEGESSFLS